MSSSIHVGKLEAIYTKRVRGGQMDPRSSVALKTGSGIVGSPDQGGKRQVTLIDKAVWEQLMAEVGANLSPSARRANLLVSGIDLKETRERVLRVGGCRLKVWGETRPCEQMDAAAAGLTAAMRRDWRGGVFAEILDDGQISVGDPVHWVEED